MKSYNVPTSKLCTCEKKESDDIVFSMLLNKYPFIHSKLKPLKEPFYLNHTHWKGFKKFVFTTFLQKCL